MNIKRYEPEIERDPYHSESAYAVMEEEKGGEYVKYEDAKADAQAKAQVLCKQWRYVASHLGDRDNYDEQQMIKRCADELEKLFKD